MCKPHVIYDTLCYRWEARHGGGKVKGQSEEAAAAIRRSRREVDDDDKEPDEKDKPVCLVGSSGSSGTSS